VNDKRSRNIFWLALVVVLIAAASVYSLLSSYQSEVESDRRVLLGRGQTALDALKAGILAHGRMGRYRGDRLAVILEELARTPEILALELRGPDGEILAFGGEHDEIPDAPPKLPKWDASRLVMARHVDFLSESGPGGAGRGRQGRQDTEDWSSFQKGIYVLTATLDTTEMRGAMRRHRVHLSVSIVVVCATLAFGSWVVVLLLKRTELAAELERERERAGRQEQIARLGAGLAHETRNPLGIVRGLAQSICDCSHHDCPVKDQAKNIVDEVDRVIGCINSFLALARPKEADPKQVDLDLFFEIFLPLVEMDSAAAEVDVHYTPCKLNILADEDLLRRSILNLILNALRASQPGSTVQIVAECCHSTLSLRVSDTGCGIAPDDLPRVTEPYFTRFSGGSGLGLSIVDQIAAAHGWRLRISSVLGQGTQAALDDITLMES
jgi:signal transduction histidine kinase